MVWPINLAKTLVYVKWKSNLLNIQSLPFAREELIEALPIFSLRNTFGRQLARLHIAHGALGQHLGATISEALLKSLKMIEHHSKVRNV